MGGFCGLRIDEMVKMQIKDIEDKESVLLVKVPETKTGTSECFTKRKRGFKIDTKIYMPNGRDTRGQF